MLPKLSKRAQTTAEYAILIAIVVGAVVAMQVYIRRGIQGRVRNVVDHVGQGGKVGGESDAADFTFTGEQYEPYYASSEAQTGRQSTEQEILGQGGAVGRATAEQTMQKREQVTGWLGADKAAEQEQQEATAPERPDAPTILDPVAGPSYK